ncbi:MAG: nickel pincer cofactor biosynthesis protein LarC [Candidatus Bathyarchaeota archaeon]|nr:nickel pincer cofactor biosynthesis protein LarC [Candidatus Bathyarchaeum tardum]WGM90125.1 MAG: nickel pincer cofactor biosynthesis protein LarC [Candidatus Bathyarchaeum tardum]WNZ29740.1 MAG: nickel pincer cofactor biosynthesis protein LarC [Candidatus Bathyarchaeota archaeon]
MPKLNKIAVIDCQMAGVAGDMVLAALLDLGANKNKVTTAIKSLENPNYGYEKISINLKRTMSKDVKATTIDVTAKTVLHMQGSKLIEIVETCSQNLDISTKAKQFASNTIRTLVGAEAKIHNTSMDHTHMHEVGLVDTAAEIIGAAVALDDLGLFDAKIYSTPVSVGGGLFKFSHGTMSSPAPATLAIFQSKQFAIQGGPIEKELATPTGAAILVNLVDEVSRFYPAIVPVKVGYGAGTKTFEGVPNVLRITIGNNVDYGLLKEEVAVLETNLDDVTGEILGHTIEVLTQEGAKDVTVLSGVTKKSRPNQILKVIADKADVEHLSRVIMDETGTLGVRICSCERLVINRELVQLELPLDSTTEKVTVKVAKDTNGEILRVKPEFEDVKRISKKTKKPAREIAELIRLRAQKVLTKKR